MCFRLKLPNHISIHDIILQTTEPAIMIAGFIIAGCIIASSIITGINFIAATLVQYDRPPENRPSVWRLECLTNKCKNSFQNIFKLKDGVSIIKADIFL